MEGMLAWAYPRNTWSAPRMHYEYSLRSTAVPPDMGRQQVSRAVQAFNLFSIIIDRLQADVAPFAPAILQLLPKVWADAEGQPLMRSQVRAPACSTMLVHPVAPRNVRAESGHGVDPCGQQLTILGCGNAGQSALRN